ncbi:Uncharacterized protein FWK35_00012974 [Aphis craccivora]|uniref:Uncharacterized protein n=1 Tax=Aphis craccivora TaxID=307492 RepID=A0A6G0YCH7_APHCR|nr:Uncharacterized protein FWK35_00012974 [Aphis craccivora]
MNIIPENQCSFINQIKLFANKQLGLCWSANVQASGAHCFPNSDGGGAEEFISFHENIDVIYAVYR